MSDVLHSDPSHMLVSILEEFCNNYAKDTGKAKQLFNLICDQLREQEIITPKCFVDENLCKPARKCFQDILQKSWQEITKDGNTQGSQSSKSIRYEILGSSFDEGISLQTNRYEKEFLELGPVGKGGFGSVYKARKQLDGKEYAVKKIVIKLKDKETLPKARKQLDGKEYAVKKIVIKQKDKETLQKLLREVQALAKLSHSFSHIVGYNTAWLEGSSRTASAESSSKESSEVSDEENSPATTDDRPMQAKQTSKTNSDSDGVEFAHREDEENRRGSASTSVKKPHGPAENSTVDNNVLMGKQGSPALQHQNFPNVKVDLINVDNCGKVEDGGDANPGLSQMNVNDVTKEEENSQPKSTITLYIQMELCRKTLYDWIIQRNDRLKSDQELRSKSSDIMRVFHEITEGVAYIHSHDIIHRDLKPLNIFLQGTGQVKIGDFGLAKEYLPSSLSERQEGFTVAGEHSEGVGTETYAAPEQIKGTRYDNKCDMYSLGIILFEMCNRFTTDMERYKTINEVRQERMPEQFTKQWPKQEELVQKLTSQTPADRPTAKTVLDWLEQELQDTVTAKETKIVTQAEQIATQERKIAAQAEQIAAQEREIVTQAKKIEAQAKEIDQLRKQLEDTKK